MKIAALSAVALLAVAGSAMAQSPYGTVTFRWREAAAGVGTSTTIEPGAAALANPAAAEDLSGLDPFPVTTDRKVTLILEARVTRAAGNTDLGGLFGMAFDLRSSDARAGSRWASNNLVNNVDASSGTFPDNRNAADTTSFTYDNMILNGIPYTPRPATSTALPGSTDSSDRGVFGPFRRIADLGGANQPAVGVDNATTNTITNVTIAASLDPLTAGTPARPGPYRGANSFYGLDTWVPVYAATYNIIDNATARDITITAELAGVAAGDSGLRGFRGQNNPQGADSWLIDNGNGGNPTYTIRVNVPAPGAAALLGLGGLVAARRRRSN